MGEKKKEKKKSLLDLFSVSGVVRNVSRPSRRHPIRSRSVFPKDSVASLTVIYWLWHFYSRPRLFIRPPLRGFFFFFINRPKMTLFTRDRISYVLRIFRKSSQATITTTFRRRSTGFSRTALSFVWTALQVRCTATKRSKFRFMFYTEPMKKKKKNHNSYRYISEYKYRDLFVCDFSDSRPVRSMWVENVSLKLS